MKLPAPLILASASPRRRELLARLDVPFSAQSADIDETRLEGESPLVMTERLAEVKARLIFAQNAQPAWVMGCDTTVALGNQVYGKPASRDEALSTLHELSGHTHQVISSVCLLCPGWQKTTSIVSQVAFGRLSEEQITRYCDSEEPYDKAGAYGIQGHGGVFVKHIDGDYSAIMGLPLWATYRLLRAAMKQAGKRLAAS